MNDHFDSWITANAREVSLQQAKGNILHQALRTVQQIETKQKIIKKNIAEIKNRLNQLEAKIQEIKQEEQSV